MLKTDFHINAYQMLNENNTTIENYCKVIHGNVKNDTGMAAEYKCEKLRLASLRSVEMLVLHGAHVIDLGKIHIEIEENLKSGSIYAERYNSFNGEEKDDAKLYYGIKVSIEAKQKSLEEKIPFANDWERIELECRREGLYAAEKYIDDAWNGRRTVMK